MRIQSKDLVNQAKEQNRAKLAAAIKSGDEAQMSEALAAFMADVNDAIVQQAAEDIETRNADANALAARGVRVLTSAEMAYYNALGAAVKSADPKMELTNFSVVMPQSIIDGVIGTIRKDHPLLDRITFTSTAYLTRWLANAKPGQTAKWGPITSAITEELSGAFKEINLTLCKLSCFMAISQDLVDLGPQWMDAYVRETLSEAVAMSVETAIVDGTGKDEPIGMTRDISSSASVQDRVQPRMKETTITDLTAATMGDLVKKLARDPLDPTKARAVDPRDLVLIVNPFDYWGKTMPATTVRRPDGTFANNVLPVPCEVFQSAALEEGKAVFGIAPLYFMGIGPTGKNGVIQADDSVKFLEDQRAYKARLQGNGRPLDEYAFLYLDISGLKPTPINVALDGTDALATAIGAAVAAAMKAE